jgi:hypothetical protein
LFTGAELVAFLVVPSLPMVPLKLVQSAGFRWVLCGNVQFTQIAGHDTMMLVVRAEKMISIRVRQHALHLKTQAGEVRWDFCAGILRVKHDA